MDLAPTQVYEDEFLPTQRISYGVNEEEEIEQVGVLTICSVQYPVNKGINKIGRHPDCNISLNNETVSKFHAEIEAGVGPGSTFICDLASSNKTKLNNLFLRPQRAYELKDGDSVKFGQVSAVYRVCRLNESTIPETPAPKNAKKNQHVIPSTPDSSLEESTACSENQSIIDDSHVDQDDKNDLFRRPSLPLQRHSADTSKSDTKSEDSHVPVARKISMGNSDFDITEMETQEFPEFNSRKESNIHEEETQRFPVNGVVDKHSDFSVKAGNSRDAEETNKTEARNEESIHDIETQRDISDAEENMHDLETQRFDFGKMPRRSETSQEREEHNHDLERQMINIGEIRQRETDDALDAEEDNNEIDIHDFETQKIDMARLREEEAKNSIDNERQNDEEDIFDDETQRFDIQNVASSVYRSQNENAATATFDTEKEKNEIQEEASKAEKNRNDINSQDTEKETTQTLDNGPIKNTNNEINPAKTNESSVIDNNNIAGPSNDRSVQEEFLNISIQSSPSIDEGGVNESTVNESQDLLKGYVEEAYFSSGEMSVKQSTPTRPSTSNIDEEINLRKSPVISDNEECIFDAPTQRVVNTTNADSDSETDEEGVFQQNSKNEAGNSKDVVEEGSKVPKDRTSFSDDSETDEEGHFTEMASREEESSIVEKEKIQNMSDRDDSAESIDIFEAATQKIEVNTDTKVIEASTANVLDTDTDTEFPDHDIFCASTQNANNVEENMNEDNSRSEEILPEKSESNDKDDLNITPTQIINEDLSDLQATNILKTSTGNEKIPTEIDDMAPTQPMEISESQLRAKDNDLSRPSTSGIITENYDLLPTQKMDENLNENHESIKENSSSKNKSESVQVKNDNTNQLEDNDKNSMDLCNENNACPNIDSSSIKTLEIAKEKDGELKLTPPKETNVTCLVPVQMEIDETLPNHLVHLEKPEEKQITSSDHLSTSVERNGDEIMNSTALDDHSIRETFGAAQQERISSTPEDVSVEDLEYELAPTQLISEVEKATEEKAASRNVSIVTASHEKAKRRGPRRVNLYDTIERNLNDTIERNLNDMFEGANERQTEEPQQMSTQHLESILQASQDNSMSSETTDDVLLIKSPSIGGKRKKKSRMVKTKVQDNDAGSEEKDFSGFILKKKLAVLRESQESNDSALGSTDKGSTSKNTSATDSQESSTFSQETDKYFSHLTTKRKRNVISDSQNSENLSVKETDERKPLRNVDKEIENERGDVYQDTSDKDSHKNAIDRYNKYLIGNDNGTTSEMDRKTALRKSNPLKSARIRNRKDGKNKDTESSHTEEKQENKITSSDDSQNSTISNARPKRNLRKGKTSNVDLKENNSSENIESLSSTESSTRENGRISQDDNKDRDVRIPASISECNTVIVSNVSDDSQSSAISTVRPKRNLRKTRGSEANKEDTLIDSKDLAKIKAPTVRQLENINENESAKSSEGIVIKDEVQKRTAEPNDDEDILLGLPEVKIYGTASIPGSPSASSTSTVHEIRPNTKQTKRKTRERSTRQNKSRRPSFGLDEEPFRVVKKIDSPKFAQWPKNVQTFSGRSSPNVLPVNHKIHDDNADDSDEDFRDFKKLANEILSVKGVYANKDSTIRNEPSESAKKTTKESVKKNDKVLSKNNTVDIMKNRSDSTMGLRKTRSTRQSSKKVDENTHVFQVPEEPPPLNIPETLKDDDIANKRKRPSSVVSVEESASNPRSKRLKKSTVEEKATPVNKSRSTRRKRNIANSGRESPSILNYLTKNNSSNNTLDSPSVAENASESNMTGQSFDSNISSNSQTSESNSRERNKRKSASTTSDVEVGGKKKKKNAASKLETPNESFSSDVSSCLENSSPTILTRSRGRMSTSMSVTLSPSSARHKVLFTGLPDKEYAKILKSLGGLKVEDPTKCTILVTDKVRRTVKFLCSLAQGTPIVSVEWLNESQAAGYFLDWESFLLKDPAMEANFGFKLAKSLNRAKQHKLLDGYTVVLTPNIARPPISELKSMILSCGGKVLTRAPAKWPEQSVIVSSEEDIANARKFLSKAPSTVTIQSTEFILTGILQQELNFLKNRLQ